MKDEVFDTLIIGAGPAGYTAGIYACRYRLNTLLVGEETGGTIAIAHKVCNFPVFPEISGFELVEKMRGVAQKAGLKEKMGRIVKIEKAEEGFKVSTKGGEEFLTKTLILAIGTKRRRLGLPEEERFLGKGVSYCATCDGPLFSEERVAVVGGSNAATTASLFLSEVAEKVYLIYRGEKLKGEKPWIESIKKRENIEVIYETNVVALQGEKELEGLELDKPFQGGKELKVKGLFVEIGSVPDKTLAQKLGLKLTKKGFIKVGEDQRTSRDGVWAAGDVTDGSNGFRQVITASSEGAIAAQSVYNFLKK